MDPSKRPTAADLDPNSNPNPSEGASVASTPEDPMVNPDAKNDAPGASSVSGDAPLGPEAPAPGLSVPGTTVDPTAPTLPNMPASDMSPAAAPFAAVPVAAPAGARKKKLMILGLVVVVVVLALLGGAAVAYRAMLNKPDNILGTALSNTLNDPDLKTAQFSGAVDVTSDDQTITATYQGSAGANGTFDVNGKVDVLLANLTFDVRSTDGSTFYFKFGGLDGLAALLGADPNSIAAFYAPFIGTINDQWFEVNQSLIEQYAGKDVKAEKLSKADQEKLFAAYKNHRFIVVKQVLADEKLKDVDNYHYKLGVDKELLKAFMTEVKSSNVAALKLDQKQLDEFKKAVDDAKLDSYPIEIWIAKKTKLISQVTLGASADGDTMKARLTIDGFNKPLNVEKPADAKSLLEVLSDYYTQLLGGTDLNVDDLSLPSMSEGSRSL